MTVSSFKRKSLKCESSYWELLRKCKTSLLWIKLDHHLDKWDVCHTAEVGDKFRVLSNCPELKNLQEHTSLIFLQNALPFANFSH